MRVSRLWGLRLLPRVCAAAVGVAVLLVAGGWGAAPVTGHQSHQSLPAGPGLAAIDAYVEGELRADRVPGAALGVVRGDRIVHLRGFGDDGAGRPVTPQTAFLLGSMSKSFTALAVMQLVEQGRIELDAPAQRYLPWFRVADPDASARISIRHLLHHTSGLPERAPHATSDPLSIEAHVRALAGVQLRRAPGAAHEYSSPNYLVLGAVIEQVTGRPYAQHVQGHIFAPLDMRQSFTDQDEARRSTMGRGHRYWFGFPRPAVLPYEADRMPTAALISSAEDLTRYLIAHLNEGRYSGQSVLSPTGVAELHRPAARVGDTTSYAMGWRAGEIGGEEAVHHGGVLPHFRGKMVMLPDAGGERWGVVVLTNASSVLPLPSTSHRVADAVAGALAGAPLPQVRPLSTFMVAYLAITAGVTLLTASQLRDLLRPARWWAQRSGKPPRRIAAGLVGELLASVAVLLGLPFVLNLPLSEVLRALPDLGYWLVASTLLGVAVVGRRVAVAWRGTRSGAPRPRRRSTERATIPVEQTDAQMLGPGAARGLGDAPGE